MRTAEPDAQPNVDEILKYSDLDRRIWEEELDDFVPRSIFDAHVHLWNDAFATPQTESANDWRDYDTGMSELVRISEILFPGRETHFLAFSTPISSADHERLTPWVAEELRSDAQSFGAMLVTPEMSGDYVAGVIQRYEHFVALKPYYALTSNPEPAITDYLPETQMEVAHELKLAVVLHLPAGPEKSLAELRHFTAKYSCIRWILAHCAAPRHPRELEQSVSQLADLPNIWYDTSGNNDVYMLGLLLKYVSRDRILFGTDNALVLGGCRRDNETFRCYEQLRTMRHACELLDVSPDEVSDLFYGNAQKLLRALRR